MASAAQQRPPPFSTSPSNGRAREPSATHSRESSTDSAQAPTKHRKKRGCIRADDENLGTALRIRAPRAVRVLVACVLVLTSYFSRGGWAGWDRGRAPRRRLPEHRALDDDDAARRTRWRRVGGLARPERAVFVSSPRRRTAAALVISPGSVSSTVGAVSASHRTRLERRVSNRWTTTKNRNPSIAAEARGEGVREPHDGVAQTVPHRWLGLARLARGNWQSEWTLLAINDGGCTTHPARPLVTGNCSRRHSSSAKRQLANHSSFVRALRATRVSRECSVCDSRACKWGVLVRGRAQALFQ